MERELSFCRGSENRYLQDVSRRLPVHIFALLGLTVSVSIETRRRLDTMTNSLNPVLFLCILHDHKALVLLLVTGQRNALESR